MHAYEAKPRFVVTLGGQMVLGTTARSAEGLRASVPLFMVQDWTQSFMHARLCFALGISSALEIRLFSCTGYKFN